MTQRTYVAPESTSYVASCIACIEEASSSRRDRSVTDDDIDRADVRGEIPLGTDLIETRCSRGHAHAIIRVAPTSMAFKAATDAARPLRFASDGDSFELTVRGYEFPRGGDSANWLLITVTASFAGTKWQATSPALETYEVAWLADWLDDVAAGVQRYDEAEFTEPNLRFGVVGHDDDGIALRVVLAYEFASPAARAAFDECAAMFHLSPADLRSAAKALRAQLIRFPPRPEKYRDY